MEDDALPAALEELREFIHGTLFPLAVKAGAASADEDVHGLLRDFKKPGIHAGRENLILVVLCASIAVSLLKNDPDGTEWAEYAGMARGLAQFAHGYLSALAGERGNAMTTLGTLGANARHAGSRAMKADAVAWFKDNRASYRSKDAAAAFMADGLFPVEFSTARDWLRGA